MINFLRELCSKKNGPHEPVWTFLSIQKQAKQKAKDSVNCGVYCAKYLRLLMNSCLDLKFENTLAALRTMRLEMHTSLSN